MLWSFIMKKLLLTMAALSSFVNAMELTDARLVKVSDSAAKVQPVEILVKQLPQVYQTIYQHLEWSDNVQRICTDREKIILDTISHYILSNGKEQVSILDIGCAQGYFCSKIKEIFGDRAKVTGIDLEPKNIEHHQLEYLILKLMNTKR
jgi:SAM-dependent methyltransferase